ncbi:uncharacterized protein V6R79_011121 [Siganus canaliculatus]
MNESGLRRLLPDQASGSGLSFGTPRHPSVIDPILSKRVCFYKSGDPQFNGLRMVINNRTFKTFDALLDSLSKKVPLPFGVRNITTPRGVHAICTLDELEDGKSYICSDSRKVKPINLALARKKLPPWYHARPVSSRRRTVQRARFFPGQNILRERVVVWTPKRLIVYRNGVPGVKHSVVLHKRTSPTFESILEYISVLLQIHVVKLHTPDGRRVDGLSGLIMCSGTVVAAGREPFKPANYNTQRSPIPATLSTNRKTVRRLKAFSNKKKSLSYISKSRRFSPSSERYIVNRIHDSIAESSCDLPSNHTNSVELESGRMLESVAETEGDIEQGCLLPAEDDIEKSFRVNQDGSMTVEMKVRLTIKEEETIHWTTTLSRSSVANQLSASCLPEPHLEQDADELKSTSVDLQSPATSTNTIDKDKTGNNDDEDPPSVSSGALSENSNGEDEIKNQMDVASPRRVPTPGHKQIYKTQASVESIQSLTAEGVQEGMIGSYSYRQQTEHGAMTEQYCMVKQSNNKPVPKPRRLGSVDANNLNNRNVSTFKSAEMTEILQVESSGEEVTETFLHIYEQQTCQDNFLANLCAQDMCAPERPATAGASQLNSNHEYEPQIWRPSTGSETISIWRAESMSVTSDFTLPSVKMAAIQKINEQLPKTKKSEQTKEVDKRKEVSFNPTIMNKHVRRIMSPGKRQKEHSTEATRTHKKKKTFSSAGFIKKIYGNKSKSVKSIAKLRKMPTPAGDEISPQLDVVSAQHPAQEKVNQARGILTRQTSLYQEKRNENESYDVSKSMSLPAFNSSSSVTNQYVENWLEKAVNATEAAGDSGRVNVAEKIRYLEETAAKQTFQTDPQSEIVRRASVKQRIRSFENKSSSPAADCFHTPATSTKFHHSREEIKNLMNPCPPESIPQTNEAELSSNSDAESKPGPVRISLQTATSLETLSMEFPPPPPPAENTESPNAEQCMMDVSSASSSPLYRLSSLSSQMSDTHPLSISSTPDKAATVEMEKSEIPSTDEEAPLSRTPSIKRAPLVSNRSLDRKMSLKKAHLDKYASCNEAVSAADTSPTIINNASDDALPNYISSSEIQRLNPADETPQSDDVLGLNSPSCCTSVSPASLTSDERMSSVSISSSVDRPFKETKINKTLLSTEKETLSPKVLARKVKHSPSPDRKSHTKKSSELSHSSPQMSSTHNADTNVPVTIRVQRETKQGRAKLQKRGSPYSQSLDMVSPPVKHKSSRKSLSRNLSLDNTSEEAQRKTGKKHHQSKTSVTKPEPPAHIPLPDQSGDQKVKNPTDPETTVMPTQPINTTNQPNMKPVLDELCYSIKSIRQITQSKRPSCLEKSNSLPDFSSHVASTFGSSSKALLAFLSVMTLKEGLTINNMEELNANNVSCAEALKMIDSLRQIASIEDSHKLRISLSDLQQSASKQLLQSWRGFQEKSKSRSSTPNEPDLEITTHLDDDCGIDERVIDEIMDNLDIPEKLKEELASFSTNFCDEGEKTLTKIIENLELSPEENSGSDRSLISTEDTINVRTVSQEEKVNVDVSSIIKKFTSIHQPKQTSMAHETETARPKLLDETTDQSSKAKDPEELDSTVMKQNGMQPYGEDQSNQETADSNEEEDDDMEDQDGESGSEQEEQRMYSATKGFDSKMSSGQSLSSSETGEQHSSEEEAEVVQEERAEHDNLSNVESPSEEDEDQEPNTEHYAELNINEQGRTSSSESRDKILYQQPEDAQANPLSPCHSEKELQGPAGSSGLNVSVDDSTCGSDMDQSSSEEDQPEGEGQKLMVIAEESLTGDEEEREGVEEEEYLPKENYKELEAVKEEETEEEDKVSSDDETQSQNAAEEETKSLRQRLDDDTSLMESDSVTKSYRFSADEDSGNDHSSCEEHVEVEQPNVEDQHISSSPEEMSYYEKDTSSEEERDEDRSCSTHVRASSAETQSEYEHEKTTDEVTSPPEDMNSKSIAERVNLLEKQVADSQRRKNTKDHSPGRRFSKRKTSMESDAEESPTSESALETRSAPQSSLSFSYDSSGVITTEPEGRVRSIREMFLAKSATDIQHGHRRFPSPNGSELSQMRADTSASGGYQSQTSSELSSGEDGSPRKSIAKGFVRRTIERLYGKKDAEHDVEAGESPSSVTKEKKKEHSSIFSPFHAVRSKAMSELSYFNSTNALDNFGEATRCIAFNAQVGPGNSVPIDSGRWLLRENTVIRKSVSDPVGINKACTNTPQGGDGMCKDTEENSPYSLFSTKSEPEDEKKSISRKCTYFSLPHASDSDICQDDLSTVSKGSVTGDSNAEAQVNSDNSKTESTERNGTLPGIGVTEFKRKDNKVHPLVEQPPQGEVVVTQPGRGQGVMHRRLQEPDVLDLLYDFCGQNCPIL